MDAPVLRILQAGRSPDAEEEEESPPAHRECGAPDVKQPSGHMLSPLQAEAALAFLKKSSSDRCTKELFPPKECLIV